MSGPRGLGRLSNNVFSAHVAEPRKARKSTGGKPPEPRARVVYDSESTEHSSTIQRGTPLVVTEFGKRNEREVSHHGSAPGLDEVWIYSPSTSNARGVEEVEEMVAGQLASSIDSLTVIDVPTSKARPKCARCGRMRSIIVCEPISGSKKCAKCYQDRRACSWAADVNASESEISDFEEELDELEKDEKLNPHGYPGQINGKCLRCASFRNNPVCERSDDPFDLKCKRCRRDKQSCSFAWYSGKWRTTSKVTAEEDSEDWIDSDSEQEAKQSEVKRGVSEGARVQENGTEEQRPDAHSAKGKEKEKPIVVERTMEKSPGKADKPQEKGKERERERPKEKEKSDETEKREGKADSSVEDFLRAITRRTASTMDRGPGASGNDTLSLLLSMLNDREPGPGSSIASVVDATTIDLLCNLLYPEDYVSVATRLSEISDVLNVLDFILPLLRDGRLTNLDATTDFNRRARRLMFKIISMNPVIPRSLIVTEVTVPAKRDYIGGGAYGGVCKGGLRGEIVALKVLYRTGDNVAFCREALMWATLKHEFVLSFLGIYKQQEEMFFISPYMENGTLAQWRKNANPSVNETRERILEVAQGMEYIHSEGVVHGDLRGDNVLLDANLHVQIADFGLTRLLDATNTQSGAKHLNFSAPELFGFDDADDPSAVVPARTQMSDVYAFGCLYYEIYYDNIPFAGRTEGQIITLVIRDKRPDRLDEPPLSDRAWEVIQGCWAREPWKRPRMKAVIESLISSSASGPGAGYAGRQSMGSFSASQAHAHMGNETSAHLGQGRSLSKSLKGTGALGKVLSFRHQSSLKRGKIPRDRLEARMKLGSSSESDVSSRASMSSDENDKANFLY